MKQPRSLRLATIIILLSMSMSACKLLPEPEKPKRSYLEIQEPITTKEVVHEAPTEEVDIEVNIVAEPDPENDSDAFRIALQRGNVSDCKRISDVQLQTHCESKVQFEEAVDSGDLEACSHIVDEKLVQKCRDRILESTARSNQNLSDCDSISNESAKTECKNSVTILSAAKTGSLQQCDAFEGYEQSDLRVKCRTQVVQTRNNRVNESAHKSQDEAKCVALMGAINQQQCRNQILYDKALSQQNADNCYQIDDESMKQNCIADVIPSFAKEQGNPELCDAIVDVPLKDSCKADANLSRDKMLYWDAKKTGNFSKCFDIQDDQLKAACESLFDL